MNDLLQQHYSTLEMYTKLRDQLMEILSDGDLAYKPDRAEQPLGALCRELGQVEQMYTDSFKTFRMDYVYKPVAPELESSVSQLVAWYGELDAALKSTLEEISDADVQGRLVERAPGFQLPPQIQLEVYREALLIFYGKAMVYLRAMGKEPPKQWQEWIG